ncbi:uncharacterized protein LOC111404702 [Olea europaea var. sylvestris]|uniref:uncharacterized protein LOC111404702 n=1 Tax=Olea europaea var. sylvestris TaxID=158386 RepID=UPI000C1D6363|nr:uncharacterized protein LOC111404702 [Olea europaea var. sylvestris]
MRHSLIDKVREAQSQDLTLRTLKAEISTGLRTDYVIRDKGALAIGNRLYVLDIPKLKKEILEEAYSSAYAMHPGKNGHDGVWIIVDRLTKTARSLPIKATYTLNKLSSTVAGTHLSLKEFVYNNNDHSSIEITPFKALYGRKCRIPICWDEVGKRKLVGPKLVQMASGNVELIKEKLKAAQDRHKSYVDRCRKDLEFALGDKVFLKLLPWKF